MDDERKKLIMGIVSVAAVAALIIANVVFAYVQKQHRIYDAQRPLLTQQEMDAAQEKINESKSEVSIPDIIPIAPTPAPKTTQPPELTPPLSQPPQPTVEPSASVPTPTPAPKPTATPIVQPTPTPKSTAAPSSTVPIPEPTAPSAYKDGDKRVNDQGEKEIYMSGIGWLPDSMGGTYEPIQ